MSEKLSKQPELGLAWIHRSCRISSVQLLSTERTSRGFNERAQLSVQWSLVWLWEKQVPVSGGGRWEQGKAWRKDAHSSDLLPGAFGCQGSLGITGNCKSDTNPVGFTSSVIIWKFCSKSHFPSPGLMDDPWNFTVSTYRTAKKCFWFGGFFFFYFWSHSFSDTQAGSVAAALTEGQSQVWCCPGELLCPQQSCKSAWFPHSSPLTTKTTTGRESLPCAQPFNANTPQTAVT